MLAGIWGMMIWAEAVSAGPQWVTVHKQSHTPYGTSSHPSIRYGHSTIAIGDQMIMTHGYFYDKDTATATWKSDTLAMSLAAPHHWHLLHKGMTQEETIQAYADGKRPHTPAGRFGQGATAHNGSLYMYGGHDGGISRHNKQNYEPGYDFEVRSRSSELPVPAHAGGACVLHVQSFCTQDIVNSESGCCYSKIQPHAKQMCSKPCMCDACTAMALTQR